MNKWFIALKKRGRNVFDISDTVVVEPPQGFYMADPFLIERNGDYLFYELYDYKKGVIAYSLINDDLSITEPRVVLELPTHISFPALFEEGDVYMTPESCLSGELAIYQGIPFPDVWEKVKIVATGRYEDPVLFKKGDLYTIHCTEGGDNLVRFTSKDLFGDWEKETLGNILHSRSAGIPFEAFGKQVYPTQDCIQSYGHRIVFKHNIETPEVYRTIGTYWHPNLTGTHTFNISEHFIAIDGRVRV